MNPCLEHCLHHIFKIEGGFVDNPADRGGPTKFGITLKTFADYSGLPSLPASAIQNLTAEHAARIYEFKYWNTMKLDRVRSPKVALILFDQGVNGGPKTAIKMLQEVLNESFGESLLVDGELGNKTDVAIATAPDARLCRKLIQKAQARYVSLAVKDASQLVFLKGWLNRTFALQDATA